MTPMMYKTTIREEVWSKLGIRNPQNLSGIILIIGDTAITHSSLQSRMVESGIGDIRESGAACRWFSVCNKVVDRGVSLVFVFNFLSTLLAEE